MEARVSEVTQEDRKAAWPFRPVLTEATEETWMAGQFDNNRAIQAFAAHRQSAIKAERERIVEWLKSVPVGSISVGMEMDMMARHRAADAIASGEHEVKGQE